MVCEGQQFNPVIGHPSILFAVFLFLPLHIFKPPCRYISPSYCIGSALSAKEQTSPADNEYLCHCLTGQRATTIDTPLPHQCLSLPRANHTADSFSPLGDVHENTKHRREHENGHGRGYLQDRRWHSMRYGNGAISMTGRHPQ